MGLFRPDHRRSEGPDPWLPLKVALFVGGGVSGVAGMATGTDWPVTLAIVLLALALVLRLLPRKPPMAD
jgi:hypothetical protein